MKHSLLFRSIASACATLALAATAIAGPLNTKGVPANSGAVIHVDFDAARNSALGKLLFTETDKGLAKSPAAGPHAWLKELGLSSASISDLTFGSASNDEGVAIIRGQIPASKIQEYATRKGLKSVTIGDRVFFELPALKHGAFALASKPGNPLLFHAYDANTAIVADKTNAPKVLAALSGKVASYTPPPYLTTYSKTLNTPPVVLGYIGPKLLKEKPGAKKEAKAFDPTANLERPTQIFFAAGDSGKNAGIRVAAGYPDAEKAQEAVTQIQGLLTILSMMTTAPQGKDGAPPDPKKVEEVKQFKALLARLKVSASGSYLTASFTYPTEDALKALQAAINKAGKGTTAETEGPF
ncbi:MAG: hypothetical protein LBT53_03630 [Puniceicoccales bacterium]|jgi:hypothetical protein|nr:hypothetical protein [Puniceicoccales bacterium]